LVSDTTGKFYGLSGPDPILGAAAFVFELSPPSNGTGPWTENVIHQLGPVLDAIYGALSINSQANLYLSTLGGSGLGCGSVYMLNAPLGTGEYFFTGGTDGCAPNGGLNFDTQGNLYGSAGRGTGGFGVVFELSPPASGTGPLTERTLYSFTGGKDGAYPNDRLIFDSHGNLYGVASSGGDAAGSCSANPPGCGLVFRLSPPSSGTGPWSETVLYTFTGGSDGGAPLGSVIFDSSGNLYGTAAVGGNSGNGAVFELIPSP
jgi:hypothetical protein